MKKYFLESLLDFVCGICAIGGLLWIMWAAITGDLLFEGIYWWTK